MRADAAVVGGLPARLLRLASDQRLVEYVRAGSDSAFEALFDRHYRSVLGYCEHMLSSREEAEDAAQQTFLVAYRDLVRSAEPVALRPWLWGIARHRCLMALRSRHERPVAELPERLRTYDLADDVAMRDEVREMLADLARLPNEQRAALVLAEFRDLSHEDIARALGCPRKRVKALVFQARASLGAARDARDTPCAVIREQLTTLRGPALRHAMLRRHLDGCPGCRAYRDAVRTRRRRMEVRLPWGSAVALKRSVIGAVSQSGGGAGCAVLTGSSLGGAAAALVAAAIPLSGGAAAVTAGHDESVRAVPVTVTARHAEQSTSAGDPQTGEVPGAARGGGDDRGRTDRDRGAIRAGEQPAPQEIVAEDKGETGEQPAAQEIAAEDDGRAAEQLAPPDVMAEDDRQEREQSVPDAVVVHEDREAGEQSAPQAVLVRDDRERDAQSAPQEVVVREDREAGEQSAPQEVVVREDREAGEQSAPQEVLVRDDRERDEQSAPQTVVAVDDRRTGERPTLQAMAARDDRRAAEQSAQPEVVARGDRRVREQPGTQPERSNERPEPATQPARSNQRPEPATRPRAGEALPRPSTPARPESVAEPPRRAGDPDPISPSAAAPPAAAQRPASHADARGGSSAATPGPPNR